MDKTCSHKKKRVVGVAGNLDKIIRCCSCQEQWDVPLTAEEKRLLLESTKQEDQRLKNLGTLGWAFQKAFYRYYQGERDGWKYSGDELMERIREFTKKHPEVVILSCDDSGLNDSMIVLIPYRTASFYRGTMMVIIPRLFGEPLEMFLDPGHALGIEKALHALNREARQKSKTEKLYWPKP